MQGDGKGNYIRRNSGPLFPEQVLSIHKHCTQYDSPNVSGRHGTKHAHPRHQHEHENGDPGSSAFPAVKHTWRNKPDPFDVAIHGLIVAFAAALIYFLQLRSMQQSLNLTREAFERDSRAYVVPKSSTVYPTKMLEDGKTAVIIEHAPNTPKLTVNPVVAAILVNSGKTPASEVSTATQITVRHDFNIPSTITTDNAPAGLVKSVGILPPDVENNVGAGYPLSGETRDAVLHGKALLLIYGVTTYVDVFKKPRQTHFCFYYVHEEDTMAPCPKGNYYN